MMLPDLTSPTTRTVLPMNDWLYGATHLELDRQGPMVVSLPADQDGRYYSVTVMHAHFNNALHLGSRWTGRSAVQVLLVAPGWEGTAPHGMRVFECPTASVCLLNRELVTYAPCDPGRVRAWRQGLRITPLAGDPEDINHKDLLHPDIDTLDDPWHYFRLGFAHLRRNPLPQAARWAALLSEAASVDLHRILINVALDPSSPEFTAGLNAIGHSRDLADPTSGDPGCGARRASSRLRDRVALHHARLHLCVLRRFAREGAR